MEKRILFSGPKLQSAVHSAYYSIKRFGSAAWVFSQRAFYYDKDNLLEIGKNVPFPIELSAAIKRQAGP